MSSSRTTNCEIIDRQQRELPLLLTDMQVLSIPIHECGDKFVDIATVNNEYIKMLPSPSPSNIFFDIDHNAGLEHSSLVRALLFTRLEAAAKNFNMIYKNDGGSETSKIVFMVFEGLRSIEDCESEGPYGTDDLYNLQKVNGGEYFFKTPEDVEKAGFQCEDIHIENSQRATGGFVSFRVYDETTSTFLDLGDVDADEAKVYLTFSKTLTHEQRRNRNTLLNACAMAGLVNYPFEWWTFCFGTQYYSYYTKNQIAIYGPIKQNSQIVKTD